MEAPAEDPPPTATPAFFSAEGAPLTPRERAQAVLATLDAEALASLYALVAKQSKKAKKKKDKAKGEKKRRKKDKKRSRATADIEWTEVRVTPPPPGVGLVYEAPPATLLSDLVAYVTLALTFGSVLLSPVFVLLWLYAVVAHQSLVAVSVMVVVVSSPMWALGVSKSVRTSRVFETWRVFFHLRVWKDTLMPEDHRKTLFAVFPHGVFPMALMVAGGIAETIFPEWGERADAGMSAAIASVFFKTPILSPIVTWMGCFPATHENVRSLVRGGSCVLLPDGIAGVFHSNRHREEIYIRARKGFVRLAIQEGANLVPTYCLGHTQLHDVSGGPGSWLMRLSRALRISVILFAGRFGLPVPHRFPLVLAIGAPIPLERCAEPTDEQVDQVHALFVERLVDLFNRRKSMVGWENRQVHIV